MPLDTLAMPGMSEPWIEAPHIWKTQAAFFAFLRGALRRAVWEKWPLKLEFKNQFCEPPPPGYTGRAKSGNYCALTGKWVGKSAAEIDHIHGHVSLQTWEDVLPFIQHLCASKENMQYVEKEAHKIKSYAERMGLTFEEAVVIKQAIEICKTKKDKQFLIEHGVKPATSAAKRRTQVEEVLKEEQ
jgi:hypothetical protein